MSEFSELAQILERLMKGLPVPPEPKKDRFGHEFPVGTVLVFHKKFPASEKEYAYAALRVASGDWYLTGSRVRQNSMNWGVLTMFIGDAPCAMPTSWVDL